jgi:hypothetical protein
MGAIQRLGSTPSVEHPVANGAGLVRDRPPGTAALSIIGDDLRPTWSSDVTNPKPYRRHFDLADVGVLLTLTPTRDEPTLLYRLRGRGALS